MNVVINGDAREVAADATLASVLQDFGVAERGVAVAVDGAVVPRASWPDTALRPGATIEVLTAVQGG
ncbi:sulfur carrier protein ThiS [Saccharopolyspora halophila]|uniref:Sulfur carrier protein ThiS n=1 Tax=Saccharopolyspora halophila TaxID=405551 RepID=A0ABP5SRT6_9PSEU